MRRAYVLGSNGPPSPEPLRYSHSDAQKFASAITSPLCGFTVEMPEVGANAWQVRERLAFAAEACVPDDTFVAYFSGHGLVDKGDLFLLWDHTDPDRLATTAIPISAVMESLRHCRAANKLAILDCCHAGAATGFKSGARLAVGDAGIRPENHLVLMASDRIERAREVDALGGGFLTHHLCAALTTEFHEADRDRDGQLSIDELARWLQAKAADHNRSTDEVGVPAPYLFGQQRGQFFLTAGLDDWHAPGLAWHDGSDLIVLPTSTRIDSAFMSQIPRLGAAPTVSVDFGDPPARFAMCVGRHPVTNGQYRQYARDTGASEPVGEHFVDGSWRGPFRPWAHPEFCADDQPVVCVNWRDALSYCDWVRRLGGLATYTRVPSTNAWDYGAFGSIDPPRRTGGQLAGGVGIHERASAPAPIDASARRLNARGLSDMIGNIWEWTGPPFELRPSLIAQPRRNNADVRLRGGSFLDDLARIKPFIGVDRLADGINTRHSDLGFRIAAEIPLSMMGAELQSRLERFPPLDLDLF
jgi:formylglycine-generating enzyme required for sulfatase activity